MTFTALLLHNPQFRRLWIAQVVSQLGDWFNAVAVYALLLDLTGSATLVAAMMVVQLLPLALVGPLAGVVVDRMSRRTLMIGADLARAVLFAGLVFVRSADQIWLAFLLVTLGVIATAFFEPARTAMLPDVVPRESPDHGQRAVGGDVGRDAGRRRIGGRRHHGARRARRGLHLQRPVVSRLRRCAAGPARRRNAPPPAPSKAPGCGYATGSTICGSIRQHWRCSASRASGPSPAG